MDLAFTWAWLALLLAMFPAGMAVANLIFVRPAHGVPKDGTLVSILVPARNEDANIATCLRHALASSGVAVEVVVMDDGSTDRTAEIVRAAAAGDPRVRLGTCPPLPPGWTGKVHACARLAGRRGGRICSSSTPMCGWSPRRPRPWPATPRAPAARWSPACRGRRSARSARR
jgi:cellulose synthase/poly-beta-1,6-N-acetylglucosamine synthase-like glycosyltransferase